MSDPAWFLKNSAGTTRNSDPNFRSRGLNMEGRTLQREFTMKNLAKPVLLILTLLSASVVVSASEPATDTAVKKSKLGVIRGLVRDQAGNPIARAQVLVSRGKRILKQVRSNSKGRFVTKLFPGTYKILAVAEGFNPVWYSKVQLNSSDDLVYRFDLQPSGSGNTLPEVRSDRSSSKWKIRAAQMRRSIYQNVEGDSPDVEGETIEREIQYPDRVEESASRKGQTVVETYAAASEDGNYTGLNFATLLPVSDKADLVLAGQAASSSSGPNRFETNFRYRANDDHQVTVKGSIASLGRLHLEKDDLRRLGQVSLQVIDEWNVSEGIVLVYGIDYSRFTGAGSKSAINPRIGFQFDVNEETRFRTAFTTSSESPSWQRAAVLEDNRVLFQEPVAFEEVIVDEDGPQMPRRRRLEFGIERILDNSSSIEANVFFDAVSGRGIGLVNIPFDTVSGDGFEEFVGNQQGKARGVRVVYSRRINGTFSTSAGYSIGNGQKLSANAIGNPDELFEDDTFQSFVGQVDADLDTGTNLTTVFRFSPQATVFAIDPFKGRMAIYDPSLSVLVTQSLPTLGLPISAEATIDARNLLEFQSGVAGEESMLKLNSQRRILRGGISVRF